MVDPEFGDVKTVARITGLSVSFLNKLRVHRPTQSPPFMVISATGGRGRVLYPLGELRAWAAERTHKAKGSPK